MKKKIVRSYSYSDAILLAHVGKVLEQLPKDLAIVEAETGSVDMAFADQLRTDYEEALKEGGDDVVKGKLGRKTQDMVNVMEESKKILRRIRFYVGEAFDDDPARKKSFNLSKFWKIAENQPELIKFMNALNTVVAANKDALMAEGATEALILSVGENATALANTDAVQENSKGGRANSTQARIIALNSLYKRVLKLDKATDIAFEEEPLKAAFYNLPQVSPKADETDDEEEDTDEKQAA